MGTRRVTQLVARSLRQAELRCALTAQVWHDGAQNTVLWHAIMAPSPADNITLVLGGVIVLVCALFTGLTLRFAGIFWCMAATALLLALLDRDMSFAAWSFCQRLTLLCLRLVGQ